MAVLRYSTSVSKTSNTNTEKDYLLPTLVRKITFQCSTECSSRHQCKSERSVNKRCYLYWAMYYWEYTSLEVKYTMENAWFLPETTTYRNSLLFRLVNFRKKIYLRKIIFGQTKLNENNFTSCVWCALIEIAAHAKEMAGEKMTCCVRGYHIYKDIWAAATGVSSLACRRWHAVVGKLLIYSCKTFLYIFCVQNYFCNEKKQITISNPLRYNISTCHFLEDERWHSSIHMLVPAKFTHLP